MSTQIKLSKNANVSKATHYPRNFENVFCPSPHAGKNLSRQYQGGSQALLCEVSFPLPTDLPRIKESLWRTGMEKKQFCHLKECPGPSEERCNTNPVSGGPVGLYVGLGHWSLSLFGASMLLLFLCDSLSQFVPSSMSLFWLEAHSPALFHQPTACQPRWLLGSLVPGLVA